MTLQQIQDRLALKDLVDVFSNLADEKNVKDQMPLFTENAIVNTYIGGKLVFEMEGRAQIEQVFTDFIAPFHALYHHNGQHTVTFQDENNATAINYCHVVLAKNEDGKEVITNHFVRYNDTYTKIDGKWFIAKRIANFMITQ